MSLEQLRYIHQKGTPPLIICKLDNNEVTSTIKDEKKTYRGYASKKALSEIIKKQRTIYHDGRIEIHRDDDGLDPCCPRSDIGYPCNCNK